MGDVSDYGTSEQTDELRLIMDGGQKWMDRMTALLTEKVKAQKAVADAQIVGDILAVQSEVKQLRERARAELEAAKIDAKKLRDEADAQVSKILAQAQQTANGITKGANDRAREAQETAARMIADAQRQVHEAGGKLSAAITRGIELDQRSAALDKREQAAADVVINAERVREHYEALTERVSAVIKQFGEITVEDKNHG